MTHNRENGEGAQPPHEENPHAVDPSKINTGASEERVEVPTGTQTDKPAEPPAPTHDDWAGLPPYEPSKTVRQDYETYNPDLSPGSIDPSKGEFLILPADTEDRFDEYTSKAPNNPDASTETDRLWTQRVLDGELTRPANGQFRKVADRESANFGQHVESEQGPLAAARPRMAQPGDSVLTGARAVQRIRNTIGLGSLLTIPLWHSGFWITLRAPKEGDLLDLHRRMSDEKVTLGRRTYGLAFANSSSFTAELVFNFMQEHLHDSTLKQGLDIRKYIKVHDLQTIAWGLACAIYPKGFQYSRSVLTGPNQEKREVKGTLMVSKLQFVDRTMLTPWQVAHMSRRTGNHMSDEMLERYQSEFTLNERRVELENGLHMVLRQPSVDDYINAGHRWIDSITDMVDRSFGREQSDEQRDRYISTKGKATVMRQFVHWIKALVEVDGEGREVTYEDIETLDSVMDSLSEVDSLREKYFEAIHKFTDDTTVSVIATPTVTEGEEQKLPRFPHLVPIDALYTFFILLTQKNNRIQGRMDL